MYSRQLRNQFYYTRQPRKSSVFEGTSGQSRPGQSCFATPRVVTSQCCPTATMSRGTSHGVLAGPMLAEPCLGVATFRSALLWKYGDGVLSELNNSWSEKSAGTPHNGGIPPLPLVAGEDSQKVRDFDRCHFRFSAIFRFSFIGVRKPSERPPRSFLGAQLKTACVHRAKSD